MSQAEKVYTPGRVLSSRDLHPYQSIILVECALVKCVLCIQNIRNAQGRGALRTTPWSQVSHFGKPLCMIHLPPTSSAEYRLSNRDVSVIHIFLGRCGKPTVVTTVLFSCSSCRNFTMN